LLFFRVDDYADALRRARALAATFEENRIAIRTREPTNFRLRDPRGYYVRISDLGDA